MTLLLIGLGAIFAAIVLTVATIAVGSTGRAGVAKALETIDTSYAPGSAALADESLRQRLSPGMNRIAAVGRSVTPKGATTWLQRGLDYAGNPAAWPPERIMEMQGLGLLIFGIAGGVAAFASGLTPVAAFGVVLAAAFLGFWAPFVVVYDIGVRRQQQLRRELPDALDLLTLSVEAGLGFDSALSQVAASMPGSLAREFSRALHEMQMGQRRADALRAMGARTTVVELRTVATAIVQAGELGIPIAQVLREQAREMRVKRRQRAAEQAGKVPVKVIFPLVLCLFPALFIVIIGPGVIDIMEAFSR